MKPSASIGCWLLWPTLGTLLGCTSDQQLGRSPLTVTNVGGAAGSSVTEVPAEDRAAESQAGNAGTPGNTGGRPIYTITAWMTEEEWRAATDPVSGEHEVETQGCGSEPIGQEYRIYPSVGCSPSPDYDFETYPVRICDVLPSCAHHTDCSAEPFGRCQGAPHATCEYPLEPQLCTTDKECTRLPEGSCSVALRDVDCYPSGKCAMPERKCHYPAEACSSDADCSAASGGTCTRRIDNVRCIYPECAVDADCPVGHRCACSEAGGKSICVPADCDSNGDCLAGQTCRLESSCRGEALHFRCTTENDTCQGSEDCEGGTCSYLDGRWQCTFEWCPTP